MLLNDQGDVNARTPMPIDNVMDSATVFTASSEAVVWYYVSSSAWAAAASQAAGTICTAALKYTGVLNSMGTAIGSKADTSLSLGATTRFDTLIYIPENVFSLMVGMSPTNQAAEVTKYLTTNGYYAIDHRRGQLWGIAKATVANDAATYKYTGSVEGSEGGLVPTVDSYTTIAINLTTGADQVLVASAAGKQIWVYGYGFTCGTANGQSVSLQDEDNTALTGVMTFAQYGGISVPSSGNFAMPVLKCATNKDLETDIVGGDVDGFLSYAIISI